MLRTPGTVYLLVTSLIGRLPTAMSSLGIVQLVRLQGADFALAGTLTAAYIVASAVGQPLLSRRIDRVGQTLVLLVAAGVSAAAFIGLAFVGASIPLLGVVFALIAGFFTAPLEPSLRSLWPRMLGEGRALKAAFSLDAGAQEVMFIVGPLLTVLGIAAFGATGNVVFLGLLGVAGAALFAVHPVSRHAGRSGSGHAERTGSASDTDAREPASAGHPSPLRNRTFVRVLVFTFGVGVPVGALTLVVTVFEEQRSAVGFAGWGLAANAFGALIGATVLAIRPLRAAPQRAMAVCGLLLALVYLPLAADGIPVPVYLLAAIVSGLLLPPTLTQIFQVVARLSARAGLTEANAWVVSAMTLGIAFGTLAASGVAGAWPVQAIPVIIVGSVLITAALSLLVLPGRLARDLV